MIRVALLLSSLVLVAATSGGDLVARAKQLQAEGKKVAALEMLGLCLRDDRQKVYSKRLLEECLYAGEYAANDLMKGQFVSSEKHELYQAFKRAGAPLSWAHYGDTYYYDNYFFRVLAEKYPDSKYADEVSYFEIRFTESGAWRQTVADCEAYLKRFPKGPYAQAVTLYLANVYHELWGYLVFGEEWVGDDPLPEHDAGTQAKVAEEFRQKAIGLYKAGLEPHPGSKMEASSYDRENLDSLVRGERPGFETLIND